MLLRDVLKGIEILSANCDMDIEISSVCHDSRTAQAGALFVAIPGFKTDGNHFVPMALQSGAVAVITETPSDDFPYIQVENARRSLAVVAANFNGNPASKLTMIGVTGTNGKTTTTYLLKEILEDSGKKVGLIGTNQNMIGDETLYTERTTPDGNGLQCLLAEMVEKGCSHVVMEVSSHSLVLDRVYGIDFEVGIFTNLSQDHLDFHGTMENYAEAKALLFNNCKYGVVNTDDKYAKTMLKGANCQYTTYGVKNDADIVASALELGEKGVAFDLSAKDERGHIELGIPGEFSVYNGLAVVSAAKMLGISFETSAKTLARASGVCGRAEVVPCDTDYTVMIDYAHSPDGLENILDTVKGFARGRIIVVFGCGGDRDATKRPIMGEIASRLADIVVVTSDNPRTEDPMAIINQILPGVDREKATVYVEESRPKAIHYALSIAREGDVVLLAGKGHETYQEINGVRHHLDEREVVQEYFNK